MSGPVVFLADSIGQQTPIRIERNFTVNDASGAAASFDPMLQTWLGGYDAAHIPLITRFNMRGIPPGNYHLFLYGGQKDGTGGTDFHVQLNTEPPMIKSILPVSETQFVENDNYARFDLVLHSARDVIRVAVVGFLNGLQLQRL